MRRFAGLQGSVTPQDRSLAYGLNGKLASGGVLGDKTRVGGNELTREATVRFLKPGVPFLAVHNLGWTIYNWTPIDVQPPGAVIGRTMRRRPTNIGIWLEADGAPVDADGKFSPPVVAVIKMWGAKGPEKPKPRSL